MKRLLLLLLLSITQATAYEAFIKNAYYDSYNYEKMGNYDDAIKSLQPLYQRYESAYTPNFRLGWLFYLNKNYNNAIKHYQQAAVALPNALEPTLGLIVVYMAQHKYDKAQTLCSGILKNDYANYHANLYLAWTLFYRGLYGESDTISKRLLGLYPTDISFLEVLASSYGAQSKIEEMAQVYEDILILDPKNIAAGNFFLEQNKK